MTLEQKAIADIIAKAVAKYIRDDQRASYPLPSKVRIVVRSEKLAKPVVAPFAIEGCPLEIRALGDGRIELVSLPFDRESKNWNGPDGIPNNRFRSMLASLFHDLIWKYASRIAAAWHTTEKEVLRWGNGILYLVWLWASEDSWWGRREAWMAYQVTTFVAPVYRKAKKALGFAGVVIAVGVSAGCGCYTVPDGEVEEVDGAETVRQVMQDYGNGVD